MNAIMLKAVNEYQCPGCMHGPDAETCDRSEVTAKGCTNHHSGTMGLGIGNFALGLPKGFNRFGPSELRNIEIYESCEAMLRAIPNLKSIFSLPIWKHLDKHENTIMRWYSPRTNHGGSVVVLGDCREQFPTAIDITAENLAQMD